MGQMRLSKTLSSVREFQTLSTKAQVLSLQGKKDEADAIMKEALATGTGSRSTSYARSY